MSNQSIVSNRKGKNSSSRLLDLPLDLLVDASDHLSLNDLLMLSQTCGPLRRFFQNHDDRIQFLRRKFGQDVLSPERLSPDEQEAYLFTLARGRPDHWACFICLKLHRVNASDTPAGPKRTCAFQKINSFKIIIVPGWSDHHHGYDLQHQHLQLMLKYCRWQKAEAGSGNNDQTTVLQRRHHEHLGRLLKPHMKLFNPRKKSGNCALTGAFSVEPRVVSGSLYLRCAWNYFRGSRPITKEAMGDLYICPHQGLLPSAPLHLASPDMISPKWVKCARQVKKAFITAAERAFDWAVVYAFQVPPHRMAGHCPLCETDFDIQVSENLATVSVWQHLGPEGTPMETSWKSGHTRDHCSKYDWSGTARAMFGDED